MEPGAQGDSSCARPRILADRIACRRMLHFTMALLRLQDGGRPNLVPIQLSCPKVHLHKDEAGERLTSC